MKYLETNKAFKLVAIVAILAVMAAVFFAGCDDGGSEASGDLLYEGSTSSEAVVAAWVGELIEAGQETMAAADTTEVVTHSMGGTPTAVSIMPDGASALNYSVGTASLTSTQFTITRSGTDTASREILWIAVK